jgi:hypothetical protein
MKPNARPDLVCPRVFGLFHLAQGSFPSLLNFEEKETSYDRD